MTISVLDRVENTVGKGKNAGFPAFYPFSTVFFKAFFVSFVKSWDCVLNSNSSFTHSHTMTLFDAPWKETF